jgi:hypothetical protein
MIRYERLLLVPAIEALVRCPPRFDPSVPVKPRFGGAFLLAQAVENGDGVPAPDCRHRGLARPWAMPKRPEVLPPSLPPRGLSRIEAAAYIGVSARCD